MLNSLFFREVAPVYSEETIDILRLYRSENVGAKTFQTLIDLFGDAKTALDNVAAYSLRGGKSKPVKVYSKAEAESEIENMNKLGARLVTYKDKQYPSLLKYTHDYPPILSYIGNIDLLSSEKAIAMVGARNASINGRSFASKIANELISNEYITVSGLARGIDTAVHSVNCQKTVAVIAGGIDNIYPQENTKLHERIAKEGLIIAEQAFGVKPLSTHFPMRNRIISGVSICTVVIEASLRSGSLITARYALEQNRDIFAMPGFPLDPRSQGTNKLIKEGAYLLESSQDIIENVASLGLPAITNNKKSLAEFATNDNNFKSQTLGAEVVVTDEDRNLVISMLSANPISFETIVAESRLSFAAIYTICLELELAGRVMRHPGGKISLIYNLEE